jgi:hypothetical protein
VNLPTANYGTSKKFNQPAQKLHPLPSKKIYLQRDLLTNFCIGYAGQISEKILKNQKNTVPNFYTFIPITRLGCIKKK